MNSLPHIIAANEEAALKAMKERMEAHRQSELNRLLHRLDDWMFWVKDAIGDSEEDSQGIQIYEFLYAWRCLIDDSGFEIGDYTDMFRTVSDVAVTSPAFTPEYWGDEPAMEILQCDRCQADLEAGQIGLCDDCQDQDARDAYRTSAIRPFQTNDLI